LEKWWYNASFHTSKKIPIFGTLWISSSIHQIRLKGTTKVQTVEEYIGNQQEVLKVLKENLVMAQNKMKQVDQHRSEKEFEVGDSVFLRLQPYK
jgi:hypothetical protein